MATTFTFTYSKPSTSDFPTLPSPTVGATGHFTHHEQLESKLNVLNTNVETQVNAMSAVVKAYVEALDVRISTLETKTASHGW